MASERNDFIRDIIDSDLSTGRHQSVATRFPPEPNGYLHIGHAKSICLNFGLARDYKGTCNLRYDDTNPTKEDVEYVESIERDVRWLGFAPSAVLFSADYFGRMYELAERLVTEGKAYVCDLTDEQIREYRGTLSEPGKPSPNRDRSVEENLKLLRAMKGGSLPDGACTLRAKIDMASSNMKMRDPLLYRIRHAHHHRSGDAWCIYPMYDWAHPIEDAIEGITHSICTLEFENNRELYDWVLDNTGPWSPRPHQYEFARLALDYTVMSKRKLLTLVKDGHVNGWDDPRMPTIAGMRRRGFAPEALRAFCDLIGVSKANSTIDIGKLEYCVREELNKNATRALGVIDPLEVAVSDGRRIFIERDDWRDEAPDDYKRLAPGRVVRLRHAGFVRGEGLEGGVLKVTALTEDPPEPKKIGVIHWVDAATSVPAEVRLYDRLFGAQKPEEGGVDFIAALSPESLTITKAARLNASFATAEIGSRWQLERVGYFRVDEDSKPGAIVLNRIITLRDEREAVEETAAPAAPKVKNKKAETRPKLKSGPEYRAEARNRDANLASAYAKAISLDVSEEQADLLTGDIASATLFLDVLGAATGDTPASFVAKMLVNDVPPDDRGKLIGVAEGLAYVIGEVHRKAVTPATAKKAIANALERGTDPKTEAETISSAPVGDVGAAVEAAIAANPKQAEAYRAGKTSLIGFFVGQVMRATPNLDAAAVNAAVAERLK